MNKEAYWVVAYRRIGPHEQLLPFRQKTTFLTIPENNRYWYADPFLYEDNGVTYIFMEVFDRQTFKGSIGYSIINGDEISDPKIILNKPYHLSFPFVFQNKGQVFMIPESESIKKVLLFKATDFPHKWEEEILLEDIQALDTVKFNVDNEEWIVTSSINDDREYSLLLYSKFKGKLLPHPNNPIKSGKCGVRGAGAVFRYNNAIVRPSQDCKENYGQAIMFWEIKECNNIVYKETLLKRITPANINIDGFEPVGIHTYNQNGMFEVIDLKRYRANGPINKLRYLLFIVRNALMRSRGKLNPVTMAT
jgi:hypothetical protein